LDLTSGQAQEIVSPSESGRVLSAHWSPDGQRAAWSIVETRQSQPPLWRVTVGMADGSSAHTIVSGEGSETFEEPVWAPDGQSLYVLHRGYVAAQFVSPIERIGLSNAQRTPVFDQAGQVPFFDVSPNGRWLVVARISAAGPSLTLADLVSGEQRRLIAEGVFANLTSPRFDRSSATIRFAGASLLTGARVPATDLASLLASILAPVAEAHGLPQDLWSISVSGGQPQLLLSLMADDPVPAWSLDETQLAILAGDGLSIRPAGGGEAMFLLPPGETGTLDWSL
jgi:Tol biopolymer transport system component